MILGITKRLLVVDAETCSAIDLPARGADVYWRDKSTRTLMVGFRTHGEAKTYLYQPHLQQPPSLLLEAAASSPEDVMLVAFNSPFDRQALLKLGIKTRMEQWLDLMLLSYALAFAGRLDDVLAQFGVCDAYGRPARKNPEGKRLIQLFSVKQNPWFYFPEQWSKFANYCEQDVEVEDALLTKCLAVLDQPVFHPMVQRLQQQWLMDQRMNAAGLPVSTATVRGALAIKKEETEALTTWMKRITGLDNPNSVQQLQAWCAAQGHPMADLQAASIRNTLDYPGIPDQVHEVLEARLQLGKASVKKFDAMAKMMVDGRLRNGYVTCGASRTGRTASRGINLSNLERPKLKALDYAADLIETGSRETLRRWLYGPDAEKPTMEILGSCVRSALKAPPGRGITAVDLKSIESVGLAWLAGCDTILDLFWAGKDTYKDFATRYYGVAYEDVTSEQRTFSKVPVLSGGYGASGSALVEYAAGMNIIMEEETANRMVATFRESFSEIPLHWRNVENAAKQAVLNPGQEFRAYACDDNSTEFTTYRQWPYVSFFKQGEFLYCGLPSGRFLFYHKPEVLLVKRRSKRTGNQYEAASLHYYGRRQDTGGAWTKIATWGGKLVENVTQALCRDVLYNGLELLEGYSEAEVVASTYDEIIALTAAGEAAKPAYDHMVKCMTTPAPWMDGRFFLGADGYYGKQRYRK